MTSSYAEPEIILDLSRLLSRVLHATPTGVDRCEMAYARGLLAAAPERLAFAAVHPSGIYGRLPHDAVRRFLDVTEERWDHRGFVSSWEKRRFAAAVLAAMRPRLRRRREGPSRPFYVQASPNNLSKPKLLRHILQKEDARFICLIHDLIPLQFPEYARPGGAAEHEIRVRTALGSATGLICNSQATLNALAPWMTKTGHYPEAAVAHLGTHLHGLPHDRGGKSETDPSRPYFLSIGTIEPRKNHLLLLNIWRQLAKEKGARNIPKLVLVGRRGWENEQIVDMLERCPALKDCVLEEGRLSDSQVAALLPDARALLMPSFAEGYGMPVTESLAVGTPVLCSDLPALREAGGNVPDYLDPIDGPGWIRAIADLCKDGSPRQQRQKAAMGDWRPPSWQEHVEILLGLLHRVDR